MKIERFKAQMDGLQRANRYNISMFGTGAKTGGLSIRGLKCDSATMPGRGFFTPVSYTHLTLPTKRIV